MASIEGTARTVKNYVAMGVGAAFGYGTNNKLIRLGARVSSAVTKWNLVADKHVKLVGNGAAICVYLSVLAWGYHKSGVAGDFFVGFAAGALIDEVIDATG